MGPPEILPEPGAYVAHVQGIYASSAPEICDKSLIRDGVCGSVLVRAFKADEKEDISSKGEIGGFMYWWDPRSKSSLAGEVLCFCDALDGLLDAGWSVASSEP